MLPVNQISVEDFEATALPHIDDLFRTALRVIGNRGEAEDIVQETYLQAWKSFHRFQPGTNCRAWLFKILFHVIHHYRRRWFNIRLLREREEVLEEMLIYEPNILETLSNEDILSALQKVPQQYREVLLLADVEDFSYKEIAETLEIPIGTVMSRLSRARKLLKTELTRTIGAEKTRSIRA
ncbi:MAG: sigma-70 family RNA polymerase sigma factor, partial [Acidobacteriota bacterium]